MNSDEYHGFFDRDDEINADLRRCRFCGKPWVEHDFSCPLAERDDNDSYEPDDPYARGREEDRAYRDPRER